MRKIGSRSVIFSINKVFTVLRFLAELDRRADLDAQSPCRCRLESVAVSKAALPVLFEQPKPAGMTGD